MAILHDRPVSVDTLNDGACASGGFTTWPEIIDKLLRLGGEQFHERVGKGGRGGGGCVCAWKRHKRVNGLRFGGCMCEKRRRREGVMKKTKRYR